MEFCNFNHLGLIDEEICKKLNLISNCNPYPDFRKMYELENEKKNWNAYLKKPISNVINLTVGLDSPTKCGIDFPILFSKENNDSTIIIIAQDPLRNDSKYFSENNAKEDEDVIIGTPFSLHQKYFRNHFHNFFSLIQLLVEEKNWNVYITDSFKLFANGSIDNKDFKNNPKHKEILLAEFDFIECKNLQKNSLVIASGKEAAKIVIKLFNKTALVPKANAKTDLIELTNKQSLLPVVHFTGNGSIWWKKFFEANSVPTYYKEGYKCLIKKYLAEVNNTTKSNFNYYTCFEEWYWRYRILLLIVLNS